MECLECASTTRERCAGAVAIWILPCQMGLLGSRGSQASFGMCLDEIIEVLGLGAFLKPWSAQ